MNIVHIVRSLELGGLERLAVDLAVSQKEAGNRVKIYCVYKHEPVLADEAERAGIRVVYFNKVTGFSIRTLWEMVCQLRHDRASVVHTHNELVHTYGTIGGRLAGVPCIVNTIHGTKMGGDARSRRKYRILLLWTDAVVTVSSETANQFATERAYHRKKFHVIRNGIPVEKFVNYSARPGSAWPRIRFGTVARLVEVKDQATLIRAFHIVHKSNPHAELHILGDGPLRPNLEKLSKELQLESKILFYGASPKVAEFLSGLDVFVLSSVSEGLPIAVLEAMSAGLPIVSTRVGGICEVAPEHEVAAYSVPGHPESLGQTMQSMLEPKRMRIMGQNGQAIARQSFTIEAMGQDYEVLYRTLYPPKTSYSSSLPPRLT